MTVAKNCVGACDCREVEAAELLRTRQYFILQKFKYLKYPLRKTSQVCEKCAFPFLQFNPDKCELFVAEVQWMVVQL